MQTLDERRYYLAVVQREPVLFRNGAPFAGFPASFKRLQADLAKRDGGDREIADTLALVLHHDERLVEQASSKPWKSTLSPARTSSIA